MRRHLLLLGAVLATAAAAFGPVAGTASAATAAPTARVYLVNAFFSHGQAMMVPGRPVQVVALVRPYVAGQRVAVQGLYGQHAFTTHVVRLRPSKGGRYGVVRATIQAPRAGLVRIEVSHRATPQLLGFSAGRGIRALDTSVGFGAHGAFVSLIQSRLAALHFYLPQTGVYDLQTGLAVDAYHRLLHQGVSQLLDARTVSEILDGVGTFQVRYPGDGKHVEGNLGDQLLALINGDKVYAIYPISSGKPSTPTILGRFAVYRREPGLAPDGMYYSDYFYSGYAIHGYDPAPDYPASHGCMRLPMTDAISVWNWLSIGVRVDVYYP